MISDVLKMKAAQRQATLAHASLVESSPSFHKQTKKLPASCPILEMFISYPF
jgi:methionine-rich copper-binding protein CopC